MSCRSRRSPRLLLLTLTAVVALVPLSGACGADADVVGSDVVGSDVVGSDIVGGDVVDVAIGPSDVGPSDVGPSDVVGSDVVGSDVVVGDDVDVVDVAVGAHHRCALHADGRVRCAGANDRGQLGDGTTQARDAPVVVDGLWTAAVDVAAGAAHTCAALVDGTVQCWGDNARGQLGAATPAAAWPWPVDVRVGGALDDAAALAGVVGLVDATCARGSDGAARCWGER